MASASAAAATAAAAVGGLLRRAGARAAGIEQANLCTVRSRRLLSGWEGGAGRRAPAAQPATQALRWANCCNKRVSVIPPAPTGAAALTAAAYHRVRPAEVSAHRPVPPHIVRPGYVHATDGPPEVEAPELVQSAQDLEALRRACELAADALAMAGRMVAPGVTTDAIDAAVHDYLVQHNAYPSCLGYLGFPKAICTSVNDVIAHGIPDARPLEDGDIINIDITAYIGGFHGDTSRTFAVGEVDARGQALVKAAEEAMWAGINVCAPGTPVKAIGEAVYHFVAKSGFQVCPSLCGHGIGRHFHTPPMIASFPNDEPWVMEPGMVFTVEPCVNEGDHRLRVLEDNWTAVTVDGLRSAQFEHTIIITDSGFEILTKPGTTSESAGTDQDY